VHHDVRASRVDHRLDRQRHPRKQLRAAAGGAEVRDLRILVVRAADAVADEAADDGESSALDHGLDGVPDVGHVVADARLVDARSQRLLADVEEPLRLGVDLADAEGVGAVRDEPIEGDADVDSDHVSLLGTVLGRDPVHDHRVRRDAEGRGIAAIALRRRHAAALADEVLREAVELEHRDPRSQLVADHGQRVGDDLARACHSLDLLLRFPDDHRIVTVAAGPYLTATCSSACWISWKTSFGDASA
jgi:hypothetical protein